MCVEEISEWIATGDIVATSGSTRVSRMGNAGGNARDILVRDCAVLDDVRAMWVLPMAACVNERT